MPLAHHGDLVALKPSAPLPPAPVRQLLEKPRPPGPDPAAWYAYAGLTGLGHYVAMLSGQVACLQSDVALLRAKVVLRASPGAKYPDLVIEAEESDG
jgi:hypothetical protein